MTRTGRRSFLAGVLVLGGSTAVLSACGNSSGSTSAGGGLSASQLDQLRVAVSLELLAISAYRVTLTAASAGEYGPVPPSFTNLARAAQLHHQAHASSLNELVVRSGGRTVDTPDPELASSVLLQAGTVRTATEWASLATELENMLGATHQVLAGTVTDVEVSSASAGVGPVELQHAAMWSLLAGQYPGVLGPDGQPTAFAPITFARPATDVTGGHSG